MTPTTHTPGPWKMAFPNGFRHWFYWRFAAKVLPRRAMHRPCSPRPGCPISSEATIFHRLLLRAKWHLHPSAIAKAEGRA